MSLAKEGSIGIPFKPDNSPEQQANNNIDPIGSFATYASLYEGVQIEVEGGDGASVPYRLERGAQPFGYGDQVSVDSSLADEKARRTPSGKLDSELPGNYRGTPPYSTKADDMITNEMSE